MIETFIEMMGLVMFVHSLAIVNSHFTNQPVQSDTLGCPGSRDLTND